MTYRPAEAHAFRAAEAEFLYLVPSGAIFRMEGLTKEILDLVRQRPMMRSDIVTWLIDKGHGLAEIESTIDELDQAEVLTSGASRPPAPVVPLQSFPLQRVVLNVTNQCNLACTYCYEYSADRIAQQDGKPKYMSADIAESAVEMLIKESAGREGLHVTFFGGETLLNFPVMRSTVEYATRRVAELGKRIEFSLTTNATLLTEEIVEFLSEHRIGVTVSVDG